MILFKKKLKLNAETQANSLKLQTSLFKYQSVLLVIIIFSSSSFYIEI
jgi:hypothetical protein